MKPAHTLALGLAGALTSLAAQPAVTPTAPAGAVYRCPATLSQSPVADAVPQGWVLRSAPGEFALQRAAFYDGDPVGLGSLVPDATHRAGRTETSTWQFAGGDSARIWIGCLYRDP